MFGGCTKLIPFNTIFISYIYIYIYIYTQIHTLRLLLATVREFTTWNTLKIIAQTQSHSEAIQAITIPCTLNLTF